MTISLRNQLQVHMATLYKKLAHQNYIRKMKFALFGKPKSSQPKKPRKRTRKPDKEREKEREIEQLKKLSNLQSEEIDALKNEIEKLQIQNAKINRQFFLSNAPEKPKEKNKREEQKKFNASFSILL